MKEGVYVIFLTEAAVAWFVAGVISPFFNNPKGINETLPYLASILIATVFLYGARFLERKSEQK